VSDHDAELDAHPSDEPPPSNPEGERRSDESSSMRDADMEADAAPVRRVGRGDRKARIARRGSLFPPDAAAPPLDVERKAEDEGVPVTADPDAPYQPPESAPDDTAAVLEMSAADVEIVDAPRAALNPVEATSPPLQVERGTGGEVARPRRRAAPSDGERYPPLPDELDQIERRAASKRASTRAASAAVPRPANVDAQNRVTLIALALSLGLIVYFGVLWVDPYSRLNLFAPPTPFPLVVSMTPTASPTLTPTPTVTPSATRTPSPTVTPSATQTVIPTATFTPISAEALGVTFLPDAPATAAALTLTPGGSTSAASGYPFALLSGGLIYIANPEGRGGCNWSSIAGSVSDVNGEGINGYTVRIVGENVDSTLISGSNRGFGGGGYELPLSETARDATYTVTLYDPNGVQVSAPVTAITRADCANITAVRFVGVN